MRLNKDQNRVGKLYANVAIQRSVAATSRLRSNEKGQRQHKTHPRLLTFGIFSSLGILW